MLWLGLLFSFQLEPTLAAEKIGVNRAPKPLENQSILSSAAERKAWVKNALSAPVSYTHLTLPTNREV